MALESAQSSSSDLCDCGRAGRETRISGGTEARPNQFPWMVRLEGCGGSLISDRHILTAHHCINHGGTQRGDTVKVAVHNQTDPADYQEAKVEEIYYPSSSQAGNHDIAIITLASPLTFATKIQPVCLPSSAEKAYEGEKVTTMGWGMTHQGSGQSPILRHVQLTVAEDEDKTDNFLWTKAQVEDGVAQDSCNGDSGGPLVHRDEVTGRYTIIGTVVGEGYSCESNTGHDKNGKWAKVTAHLSWIHSILRKDAGTFRCANKQDLSVCRYHDLTSQCRKWKDRCDTLSYKNSYCPKTCKCSSSMISMSVQPATAAKPCAFKDVLPTQSLCQPWKASGFCERLKSYMDTYCKQTCHC